MKKYFFIFLLAFSLCFSCNFNVAFSSASATLTEDQQAIFRTYITTYVAKYPTCNSYYIGLIDGEPYLYLMPRIDTAEFNGSTISFNFLRSHYDENVDDVKVFIFKQSGLIRTIDVLQNNIWSCTGVYAITPIYSNFSVYNSDGTAFFQRRPLAGRILEMAEETALGRMIPRAIQMGKVLAIIVIGTVVFLMVSIKLLRKLPVFAKK